MSPPRTQQPARPYFSPSAPPLPTPSKPPSPPPPPLLLYSSPPLRHDHCNTIIASSMTVTATAIVALSLPSPPVLLAGERPHTLSFLPLV
ncbi:hypothetical protein E2C01_094045 [Portunus trituberculatus]|uniref:Uncharacterized protein n=1 Tax=Portunus trituberculatus TaxID=210409 RepID=A0A5B7JWK5_PORTR|nr:hypothetical protein [Portunus trituberculatus]